MKIRTKAVAAAPVAEPEKKQKPVLVSVHKPVDGYEELNKKKPAKKKAAKPAATKASPATRGGVRQGAGRPAYLRPEQRKKLALYMSATDAEKQELAARAERDKLTISYYMRKCCGLSIND